MVEMKDKRWMDFYDAGVGAEVNRPSVTVTDFQPDRRRGKREKQPVHKGLFVYLYFHPGSADLVTSSCRSHEPSSSTVMETGRHCPSVNLASSSSVIDPNSTRHGSTTPVGAIGGINLPQSGIVDLGIGPRAMETLVGARGMFIDNLLWDRKLIWPSN